MNDIFCGVNTKILKEVVCPGTECSQEAQLFVLSLVVCHFVVAKLGLSSKGNDDNIFGPEE